MAVDLLIKDRPWLFLPRLAYIIGTDEAIMVQQLHWIMNDAGIKQIELGAEDWSEIFFFIAKRTLRRRIESLMEQNVLCRKKRQGQASLWWINHLQLATLANESGQSGHSESGQIGQPDLLIRYILKKYIYPLDGQSEESVLETLKRQAPHQLVETWWNALAKEIGLAVSVHPKPGRIDDVQRVIEEGMLDNLDQLERALRANPYYAGANPHHRATDLDWFLRPGKWQQILDFGKVNGKREYTYKQALDKYRKLKGNEAGFPGDMFELRKSDKKWIMTDTPTDKLKKTG